MYSLCNMVTVMLESVLIIIILFTYLGTPILALTGTADGTYNQEHNMQKAVIK